jgi:hypothetical protein
VSIGATPIESSFIDNVAARIFSVISPAEHARPTLGLSDQHLPPLVAHPRPNRAAPLRDGLSLAHRLFHAVRRQDHVPPLPSTATDASATDASTDRHHGTHTGNGRARLL